MSASPEAAIEAPATLWQRMKRTYYAACTELTQAKPLHWLLFGATAGAVVFEASPANEYVQGATGARLHESLDESASLGDTIINSLGTGAIVGATSFGVQLGVGLLTAGSVDKFQETFRAWNKEDLQTDTEQAPDNSLRGTYAPLLLLGTSVGVVVKNFRDASERSFGDNANYVLKGAAVLGVANVGVGAAASGALRGAEHTPLEPAADYVLDAFTEPLSLLSHPATYVIAGGFAVYKAGARFFAQRSTQSTTATSA